MTTPNDTRKAGKLLPYVWLLKCGHKVRYRSSPPRIGDHVTCYQCAKPTTVVRRVRP